ncbi:hypothetical protein GLYMA_19G150550v4 [Glycine max]|nr:hypothetical protein GLYMA_19G150550v4 [Glycine max]KAH1077913.1 hypothetical protein GYH30_053118 [Glycine max]
MLLSFILQFLLFKLTLAFVSVLCCMTMMIVLDTGANEIEAAGDCLLS